MNDGGGCQCYWCVGSLLFGVYHGVFGEQAGTAAGASLDAGYGGLALRFQLYQSTLCIVNVHWSGQPADVKLRNSDFLHVCRELKFDLREPVEEQAELQRQQRHQERDADEEYKNAVDADNDDDDYNSDGEEPLCRGPAPGGLDDEDDPLGRRVRAACAEGKMYVFWGGQHQTEKSLKLTCFLCFCFFLIIFVFSLFF